MAIAALVGCGDGGGPDEVVLATPHDSLQFLTFHVAVGGGFFEDEGLEVTVFDPATPTRIDDALLEGETDAVVLPAPRYIEAIGNQDPIVLFANLTVNDTTNIVMRESVRQSIGVSPTDPLADRVNALSGLDIGVARGPVTRLDILLSTQGLDIEQDVNMMMISGEQQNAEFGNGTVDALLVHTPYLEEAVANQDATLLINISSGEVAELADLQRHALVTTRQFADENPMTVLAMTRAIYQAEQLIHSDLEAAKDAVNAAVPGIDPTLLDTIMPIMEPAMAQTPQVSVEGVMRELAIFPAHKTPPDLSDIDLNDYLRPEFAEQVVNE